MEHFNVHQAKTHLSRLLERAHAGEEIVISKNGQPYARLMPLAANARRELGFMAGQFEVGPEFFEPLAEDELRSWEGG
jgi:prevent-host-death family protein